ncbi:hypothetical protein RND81_09G219800 [Saponaria officinalis]|uniref:Peptidase A1 domain-containing protein n=1 Tax=Saponaria officinalis TaxID=3572 RepID=A0AAW1INZ0_SAPOF
MTLSNLLHLLLHVISMLYQTNAFSLQMYPIDSPHLQILPKHFTMKERHHFLRDISLSRAFLYDNNRNAKLGLNSIHAPLSNIQKGYFVTKFTIGDPDSGLSPIVLLDITADLTWIQCSTCNPCFNLNRTFSVETSESYVRLNPTDLRCSPKMTFKGSCGFNVSLGNSRSEGYIGADTISFDDISGFFPNIAFGCGVRNTGIFFGNDTGNVIAGVYGLGIGPRSMITQLEPQIKGKFTYCIRPTNKTSTIFFGDDAHISGSEPVQRIAMVPEARYHLRLAGITVKGKRLIIEPSIFQLDDQNYTSGFFIDPSAPYTVLSNTAYNKVKEKIVQHFSELKMEPLPINKTINTFDLCYGNSPDKSNRYNYPTMAFNFLKSGGNSGEVNLILNPKNIFGDLVIGNNTGFCFQMLPTPDQRDGPSILGAYQQRNFQFLFDINAKSLSFVPKNC